MLRALWYAPGLAYAAIYAVFALVASGHVSEQLATDLFDLPLTSGTTWHVTYSHIFVVLSLICLAYELLRTGPMTSTLLEHAIAALSCVAFLALFILAKDFGTTEFLLATVISALDFLAGGRALIKKAHPKAGHETKTS